MFFPDQLHRQEWLHHISGASLLNLKPLFAESHTEHYIQLYFQVFRSDG